MRYPAVVERFRNLLHEIIPLQKHENAFSLGNRLDEVHQTPQFGTISSRRQLAFYSEGRHLDNVGWAHRRMTGSRLHAFLIVHGHYHAIVTGDVTAATQDRHLVVRAMVTALATLKGSRGFVSAKLEVSNYLEESERADAANKLFREPAEKMRLLAKLPFDVLHLGFGFYFGRFTIGGSVWNEAVLKVATLEDCYETLRRFHVTVMFGDIERVFDPITERLSLLRPGLETLALQDVIMQTHGIVDRAAQIFFASDKLSSTGRGNMLTGFLRGLGVILAVGEIQREVTAPLEKSFFGGLGIGQSFFQSGIAVADRHILELRFFAPVVSQRHGGCNLRLHFQSLQVMLEFQVDSAFRSGESNGVDVFHGWNVINLSDVLPDKCVQEQLRQVITAPVPRC